jgi:hypothetical protein
MMLPAMLLFVLVAAAVGLSVAWITRLRRSSTAAAAEPTCGRCNYSVVGCDRFSALNAAAICARSGSA